MTLARRNLSSKAIPEASDMLAALIDTMSDPDLLRMRALIDQKLDVQTLESLDVGAEISLQLRTLKVLQAEALADSGAQHQHKASAASTVSRMLQELTKSRLLLAKAEEQRKIDTLVIQAMEDAPPEAKKRFYESLMRTASSIPSLASLVQQVQAESEE